MNKKTQKKYVALLTMLAMVICTMFCTNTVKADTENSWDPSDVVKVTKCTVNASERTLTTLKNGRVFFQVDNQTPEYMCDFSYMIDVGIDKYGTIWYISISDTAIRWWNYDITGYENQVFKPIRDDSYSPIIDVESLIFDNNNLVIGYKTKDGKSHSTLTFDEMKSYFSSGGDEDDDDDPTPTPTPTVPATTPPAPTVSPVATPPTTSTPAVTPKATVTPKVSVKKKAGYNCLSLGSKITSKYKLTKGKLTWKGSSKSKKYSGIKSAAFIKKSSNLVFLTKKGKVYTLSPKGKKKCIVKKKAKKLILKNKFAVKVKVGKKFINIANK